MEGQAVSVISPARAVCSHPNGFATAHYLLGASDLQICVNNLPVADFRIPNFNGLSAWCRMASDPDGTICISGQLLTDRLFVAVIPPSVFGGDLPSLRVTTIPTFCPQATAVKWNGADFSVAAQVDGFYYRVYQTDDGVVSQPIRIPDCPNGSTQGIRQWEAGQDISWNFAPNSGNYKTVTIDGVLYVWPTYANGVMVGLAHAQTQGYSVLAFQVSTVEARDPQVAYHNGLYRAVGWGDHNSSFDVTLPPFAPTSVPVPPIDPEPPVVIPPPVVVPPIPPVIPPVDPLPPTGGPMTPQPEAFWIPIWDRLAPACAGIYGIPLDEAKQGLREAVDSFQKPKADGGPEVAPTQQEMIDFCRMRATGTDDSARNALALDAVLLRR